MYVEENNLYAIFNLEKLLDDDSIFMHLAVMLLVFKFVFIWSYSWRGIKSVRKVFAGGGSEILILVGGGGDGGGFILLGWRGHVILK